MVGFSLPMIYSTTIYACFDLIILIQSNIIYIYIYIYLKYYRVIVRKIDGKVSVNKIITMNNKLNK